ncbi:MAG TPA: Uma2 family endonuclease [Kofleriaceae bacterium]|nr:Uma2 family endonuclease [Kofleriaceae bacterium]
MILVVGNHRRVTLHPVSRPSTIATMTEAEYLEYERTHEGKHELVNGEVLAMSGVSPAHNRIQVNAIVALGSRLGRGPCQVNASDLRVRLDETGLYAYPDLTIVCGEPVFAPTTPVTLLNPRVVIEVLSETTEDYGRGAKAAHYRHRASVELLLLVDSRRRLVERQQRNADGTWTLSEHTSGAVRVLDLEVPIDELYAGVELSG